MDQLIRSYRLMRNQQLVLAHWVEVFADPLMDTEKYSADCADDDDDDDDDFGDDDYGGDDDDDDDDEC